MTILLLIQICMCNGGKIHSFNMNSIDLAAARDAGGPYRGTLLGILITVAVISSRDRVHVLLLRLSYKLLREV